MKSFKPNTIKTKKNYLRFLAIVLSLTLCLIMMPIHSALATTHTTGFFAGKYGKAQIYDVYRHPTPYPIAGSPFTLSLFDDIYDSYTAEHVDWGVNNDRYVQFVDDGPPYQSSSYPAAYTVQLSLYEANGTFVKSLSNYGTVWGLGSEGFFYEGNDSFGYFISNKKYNHDDVLTYTPTAGLITDVTDLDNYSMDATLSNLSISSGTLSPTFSGGTTSYTASVENSVNSIKVTPTVNESHATVTVNGTTVASGVASGDINLNVGDNTITVEVTAQNSNTKTYTVIVTRANPVSADATLSNLSITGGTLSPTFSGGTTSYTASVGNSVKVTPTVNESHATVTVNGAPVASGVSSGDISLNVGDNIIIVEVTAQDASTKTYTVIVTREDTVSTDAKLSNLSISSGTLSPTFSGGTTSYTATVGNSVNNIKVTPVVNESHATVTVNGSPIASGVASGDISLNVGDNTITVEVTAQDTTTKIYTVIVTREDTVTSSNAVTCVYALNDITVAKGTAESDLKLAKTVKVGLGDSSTTSTAVTWDNGNPDYDKNTAGTYTFTGTLTLPDGVTNISNLKANVNVIVQAISSSKSSSHHNSKSSSTKQINVNITDGGSDNVLSNTVLERTTEINGTKKDTLTYTNQKAKETIAKLISEGKDVARIVATDTDTLVSETQVNIPKNTLATLSSGNINLEIEIGGARISLPKESIQDLYNNGQINGDLYFRLVPINDESKIQEIKTVVSQEAVIKAASRNSEIQVLGTPMTIETNMSERSVDIVLPLNNITLPIDAAKREAFLKDLGVFIEHSDGEKVLERGEIVEYAPGVLGIKLTVNKFRDFSIVKLNQQITNNIKTGWNLINGYWYFVKNDGSMVTGWFKDTDGLWYFLCDSTDFGALGTMKTGWKFINGTWYYFNSNGSMTSNTTIDGYTLDTSGALV